jgi:hypothetical protein
MRAAISRTSGWNKLARAARSLPVKSHVGIRGAGVLLLLSVSGCGDRSELKPAPGQPLPVKPLMALTTPTPDELLTPPPYATPDRIDELMKKSAPRQTDRFDLPPPAGEAPEIPVQAQDDEQSDQVGPVTPQ